MAATLALLMLSVAAPAALAGGAGGSGTGGKIAGAAIQDLSPTGTNDATGALSHLALDGMNTVSLYVWWMAPAPGSPTLQPYSGTEDDTELEAQILAARAAGLRVSLTPLFYCNGCEGGSRSVFTTTPANLDAFFRSYTAFVDHYAALAQSSGADIFFVGSELSYLEPATSHWRSVIASVRSIFHGQLAYEENWDVTEDVHHAAFEDSVDLIGVSAYFPLDPGQSPSLAQLVADWRSSSMPGWRGRNWVRQLQQLVATYHKPIVFGEVGYMSSDYAGAHPYLNDYENPNLLLQADLYQALLETFQGYGWWAGAIWWDYSDVDDGQGNGRTFAAKPAELVLQMWYADDDRPSNPGTPLI